jgi:hypothetical protein
MICGLIQFYPLLAIPIILIYYPPDYTLARGYVYLIIGYALAKVFEALDLPMYEFTCFISGHTLKHLAADLGFYLLLDFYIKREALPT